MSLSITLACCDCAGHISDIDVSQITARGTIKKNNLRGETDTIKWFVPAVYSDDKLFWGYTSIAGKDYQKWQSLPTRVNNICTIGNLESYTRAYKEFGTVYKLGWREPGPEYPTGYPGGYVFKTLSDARRRILTTYPESRFAVFKLDTAWENTYPSDQYWHYLIEDARIKWPPIQVYKE